MIVSTKIDEQKILDTDDMMETDITISKTKYCYKFTNLLNNIGYCEFILDNTCICEIIILYINNFDHFKTIIDELINTLLNKYQMIIFKKDFLKLRIPTIVSIDINDINTAFKNSDNYCSCLSHHKVLNKIRKIFDSYKLVKQENDDYILCNSLKCNYKINPDYYNQVLELIVYSEQSLVSTSIYKILKNGHQNYYSFNLNFTLAKIDKKNKLVIFDEKLLLISKTLDEKILLKFKNINVDQIQFRDIVQSSYTKTYFYNGFYYLILQGIEYQKNTSPNEFKQLFSTYDILVKNESLVNVKCDNEYICVFVINLSSSIKIYYIKLIKKWVYSKYITLSKKYPNVKLIFYSKLDVVLTPEQLKTNIISLVNERKESGIGYYSVSNINALIAHIKTFIY